MPISPAIVDSVSASGDAIPSVTIETAHIPNEMAPMMPAITFNTCVATSITVLIPSMLFASVS